jgi:hypothetical protein
MGAPATLEAVRTVKGAVHYTIDSGGMNRFHAKDSSLDTFAHDLREMTFIDGRSLADAPRLDREGFAIMPMPSKVADFRDLQAVEHTHFAEITAFIAAMSDADETVIAGPPALRFGERANDADRAAASKVAQLVHSDTYRSGTENFTRQYNPRPDREIARTVHHNIWRTFTPAPQDWPLAMCDFRSVKPSDILPGEAAFDDENGNVSWTFEAMLFAYDPGHRWIYWPNMTRDEVLVFKRHDSDTSQPWFVPHTAFEDKSAGNAAVPRGSIEIRTISYWYE